MLTTSVNLSKDVLHDPLGQKAAKLWAIKL